MEERTITKSASAVPCGSKNLNGAIKPTWTLFKTHSSFVEFSVSSLCKCQEISKCDLFFYQSQRL